MPKPKYIETEDGRAKLEARRAKIIEAAKSIFATKGIRRAKISEIARAANVADGTVYLYFKDKKDLVRQVAQENPAMVEQFIKADYSEVFGDVQLVSIVAARF